MSCFYLNVTLSFIGSSKPNLYGRRATDDDSYEYEPVITSSKKTGW